jgi:DHA2 family multidrug resistance protein
VAFGFCVMSGSLFYMAHRLDMQIDFGTAVELRCIQAVGMAFLFVPIQTLSYSGVPPQKNNQVSGIMNLSRNMGGDIGIAFVTTFIARRSQAHQATLSAHTTGYDSQFNAHLAAITAAMEHAGSTSVQAARQATAALYGQLVQQASQLAYLDTLWVIGVATALMAPLVFLAKKPVGRAPAGAH